MYTYSIDPLMRNDLLEFLKEIERFLSYDKSCLIKQIVENALDIGEITSNQIETIDKIINDYRNDCNSIIIDSSSKIDNNNSDEIINEGAHRNIGYFISTICETRYYTFEDLLILHNAPKNVHTEGGITMSDKKTSNSFKESLRVNTPTKPVGKPNGNKNTTGNTPGEKGGERRTKGGHTR